MIKYACIGLKEITFLMMEANEGLEKLVVLNKRTIRNIKHNIYDSTHIITERSDEPYIKISIKRDNILIEYKWGKEELKIFVFSKEEFSNLIKNIDNNGTIVVL